MQTFTDTLPHNLYRAADVRALDAAVIGNDPLAGDALMERAGQAAWDFLRARWAHAKRVQVFCGNGNNGGDGLVLARLAHQAGLAVQVWQADHANANSTAARKLKLLTDCGISVRTFDPHPLAAASPVTDVLVDALLGTGLSRPVSGAVLSVIESLNAAHARGVPVLALDIPSGLSADTGNVLGTAVRADATIIFMAMKIGLLTAYAADYVGKLVFADLAVATAMTEKFSPCAQLITAQSCLGLLPRRARSAHKGDCGSVLVIGGDHGMTGAAWLAAEAAARSGAGLIRTLTRHGGVNPRAPEIMNHTSGDHDPLAGLDALIDKSNVIAIGTGLGQSAWAQKIFARVLECALPLVVDADGLNLLAANPCRRDDWILTPHPGEAARLLATSTTAVQSDRLHSAHALQKKYGGVIVLKGAGTLIVSAHHATLCHAGNPGMASGGMGDVLTGIIGALVAQGLTLLPAAQLGVCLHAESADRAAAACGERGLLAQDLLPQVRERLNFTHE